MKKILLITTGGTLSQTVDESGVTHSDGNSFKGDTFVKLLDHTKEKFGITTIDINDLINKESSCINKKDWQKIVNAIVEDYDNYDAFIITHGTNTLGYTAAAVSYAIGNLGKPVVFTGAQVSFSVPGSDTVINLENILRTLIEQPKLVGVFLVFGSKIITGTRIKKKTEFDYDAYKTFGRVPELGHIGNKISFNHVAIETHLKHLGTKSKTRAGLDVKNNFDAKIASLTEFPGMSSDVIIDLAKSNTKGFILRATGAGDPNLLEAGHPDEDLRPAFEYLQNHKIPIVITTQAPDGVASMNINAPGPLARELGAIPAFDMSMETMVTKLSWLLANGHSYKDVQRLMTTSFRGEIDFVTYKHQIRYTPPPSWQQIIIFFRIFMICYTNTPTILSQVYRHANRQLIKNSA